MLTSVVNGPIWSDLEPKSNWTDRLGPPSRTDGVVNIGPIDFPSVPSTCPSTPSISSVWPYQLDKSSRTELNCDLKIFKSNQVNPIGPVQSSSVRLVLNNTSVNEVAYNEGLISQDVEFVILREHCTLFNYFHNRSLFRSAQLCEV